MSTYTFESATHAYHNDPVFRKLVDSMVYFIETLELTPADLRAAAMFAATRHASQHYSAFPLDARLWDEGTGGLRRETARR